MKPVARQALNMVKINIIKLSKRNGWKRANDHPKCFIIIVASAPATIHANSLFVLVVFQSIFIILSLFTSAIRAPSPVSCCCWTLYGPGRPDYGLRIVLCAWSAYCANVIQKKNLFSLLIIFNYNVFRLVP